MLGHIKVVNKAFPRDADYENPHQGPLEVVGHCRACGNPVYGRKHLAKGEEPVVKRSCTCANLQVVNYPDLIQKK